MSFSHWWLQQGKVLHFISKRFGGVVEKKKTSVRSAGVNLEPLCGKDTFTSAIYHGMTDLNPIVISA